MIEEAPTRPPTSDVPRNDDGLYPDQVKPEPPLPSGLDIPRGPEGTYPPPHPGGALRKEVNEEAEYPEDK